MAYNGEEGEQISVNQGAQMTATYRTANPDSRLGNFYGREILEQLLAQPDCKGIRMYYGLDGDGNKELVLVGANTDQNDMLDFVVDVSSPCPNECSKKNPLNS